MTHRGPFQPLPFSVWFCVWERWRVFSWWWFEVFLKLMMIWAWLVWTCAPFSCNSRHISVISSRPACDNHVKTTSLKFGNKVNSCADPATHDQKGCWGLQSPMTAPVWLSWHSAVPCLLSYDCTCSCAGLNYGQGSSFGFNSYIKIWKYV